MVPLNFSALCLDCKTIFAGLSKPCPACASVNSMALAPVLNREPVECQTEAEVNQGAESYVYQP
jgi:hypothetical protein